ncbi:MAG: DUF1330 domain-containing protein [Gammaproteobacteria bacterium]|nr:DUF1330 domain-containing protein [Gammaproteobacteria bacterium]MCY4357018.1 DUF1330 domain-containing protein [Gammaproteobacteria bacterium]
MAAYLIVLAKIHDRDKFLSGYAVEAAKLVEKMGGQYLFRGSGAISLEGSLGDDYSAVISTWPDRAAAEAFWHSPEYREAAKLREGICEVEVQLIEGELTLPNSGEQT